jgi:hypothetical protein
MPAYLLATSIAASALLVSHEAALAGGFTAVPGPVAAVGVPGLLLLGGAFLAVRYFRSPRK